MFLTSLYLFKIQDIILYFIIFGQVFVVYKLIITFIYLFEQRYDVIELVNHESLMAQLKEDLLLEKELAIQEERKHYEQKINRERQLKDDEKKDDLVIIYTLLILFKIVFLH